jgi:CHAT domain-containing protein
VVGTIGQFDFSALIARLCIDLVCAPHDATFAAAEEAAAASRQTLDETPARNQVLYGLCAIESALARASRTPSARSTHERAALDALDAAGGATVLPLPVASWATDLDEHIAIVIAAQLVAILAGPSSELILEGSAHGELEAIASLAVRCNAPLLFDATQRVARDLGLVIDGSAGTAYLPDLPDADPWELACLLVSEGRPDFATPPLRRAALQAAIAAANNDALRCANLLEVIAVAEAWPVLAAGPAAGWGPVRHDPVFDAQFLRAALSGSARTERTITWQELVPEPDGPTAEVWLRETTRDCTSIVVAGHRAGAGWSSRVVELDAHLAQQLRALCTARPGDVDDEGLRSIGDALIAPYVDDANDGSELLTAILSARLRGLPIEALAPHGSALVEHTLVAVLPALSCLSDADEPAPSDPLRVVGLFDESLPGAQAEIDALRVLVRAERADGIGFNGPQLLRRALDEAAHATPFDVLTVAVHGKRMVGAPILDAPGGPIALTEFLGWRLPAKVNLACCRSGETDGESVSLDWTTACLRGGARTVVAARWSIPDESSARIVTHMFERMANDGLSMSVALRSAVLSERRRHPEPFYWAGLGLFGSY